MITFYNVVKVVDKRTDEKGEWIQVKEDDYSIVSMYFEYMAIPVVGEQYATYSFDEIKKGKEYFAQISMDREFLYISFINEMHPLYLHKMDQFAGFMIKKAPI